MLWIQKVVSDKLSHNNWYGAVTYTVRTGVLQYFLLGARDHFYFFRTRDEKK